MTTRFATPALVAGTVAALVSLAACGSSSTAATTTVAGTSAASTTAATGNTTGSSTGSSVDGTSASTTASTAAASTVPDSAATVTVVAVDGVAWAAKTYTATAKDGKVTITGKNASSIAHNLYVLDGTGKVIGDFINLPKNGSTDTRVLPLTPGTYHVVCKVPGHSNMNSTLTVN